MDTHFAMTFLLIVKFFALKWWVQPQTSTF